MRPAFLVAAIACICMLITSVYASELSAGKNNTVAGNISANTPARLVPIEREISRGDDSGIARSKRVAVRASNTWRTLWREHTVNSYTSNGEHPALPAVDFKTEMVVVVFLGCKPTGGFGVAITQVTETSTRVIVSYIKNSPSGGGITTMAITHPFHMVVVRRINKPVIFVEINGGIKP